MPPDSSRSPSFAAFVTFAVVAASAGCFCSKGVFVKAAYALETDPLTLLALRMGMAFPFFALGAWLSSRTRGTDRPAPLTAGEWAALAGLGFIGYYLSSLVNFTGLQHVGVGLERMILYTYPSIVLVGAAVRSRRRPRAGMIAAVAVAWAGIAIAFSSELSVGSAPTGELVTGTLLVFASAVSYAIFVTLGAPLARRLGGIRFTSITVGFSCLCTLAHFAVATVAGGSVAKPSPEVLALGGALAGLGTVVPSFLMGIGLKRAGARRFAVISTIGPVVSLVLASTVLGEPFTVAHGAGFVLCLAGGLGVVMLKDADA